MTEEANISCPSCGFEQPGRSVFCSKCGKPLRPRAQPIAGTYVPPPPLVSSELRPTSGWAIASLICGILFCLPLSGLLAIIFGIVGIAQTKDGRKKGFGMALAGLILGTMMIPAALMISILLPSLNRARETANRVKCASNMRQIGEAILLYGNDNQGQYPPDLATLLKTESLAPSVFVCPDSADTSANGAGDLESGGHDSYVYLGKGLTQMSADRSVPVVYEVDAHHVDGANFLFGDGHVEFVPKNQEAAVLSRAKNPTGQ